MLKLPEGHSVVKIVHDRQDNYNAASFSALPVFPAACGNVDVQKAYLVSEPVRKNEKRM